MLKSKHTCLGLQMAEMEWIATNNKWVFFAVAEGIVG